MSGQNLVQVKIKLPVDIKKWVEGEAEKNMRSQSAEIVFALKEKMDRQRAQK
ncbi:Arc domain-containing protein [Rhizobium tropici]|uniref:Arc domain-containing protein n=1 Tax=Rhizobium tropici TaxID=398 RepID=UPI001FDF56BE|nr:Arc domain-containing protein [Rhizobium tropici]